MAKLQGYECDICHKRAVGGWLGGTPNDWYDVTFWSRTIPTQYFCSKACLTAWIGGKDVPERPSVLLKRWVKAVFHG